MYLRFRYIGLINDPCSSMKVKFKVLLTAEWFASGCKLTLALSNSSTVSVLESYCVTSSERGQLSACCSFHFRKSRKPYPFALVNFLGWLRIWNSEINVNKWYMAEICISVRQSVKILRFTIFECTISCFCFHKLIHTWIFVGNVNQM